MLLAQFPYSFDNTEENRADLAATQGRLPKFSPGRGGAPPLLAAPGGSGVFESTPALLSATSTSLSSPIPWARRGGSPGAGISALPWPASRCRFEFGEDRGARYDYLYSPEELEDLAARARELVVKARETYVIFNNHPAGQAVANALELAHLLRPGRRLPAPPGFLTAFPRLAQSVMQGEG